MHASSLRHTSDKFHGEPIMAAIAPPTGSSPISTAAIDPFLYPDSHGILTRNWGEIQQRFILSLFFFGMGYFTTPCSVFRNTAQARNSILRLHFIWEVAAARDLRFIHRLPLERLHCTRLDWLTNFTTKIRTSFADL